MPTLMPAPAKMRLALCIALLLTLCEAAAARDWQLAGLGLHQETGRDIYLGGIYLAAGTPRPGDFSALPGPWKMEYRIVARRTSIRSLLGGMLLQSEVATGRPPGPATTEFANGILSAIRSSLYAGDAFDIVLDGNVTHALLDGQLLARSSNPGVASYFLMGWIGEQGPASAFRSQLLATQVDPDLRAQYDALAYSAERRAEVAAWSGAAEPAQQAGSKDAQQETTTDTATLPAATAALAGADTTATGPMAPDTGAADPPWDPAAAPAGQDGDSQTIPPGTAPEATPGAATPLALVATPDNQPGTADALASLGVQEYSQRLAAFQGSMVARVYSKISYPKRAVRRSLQGRLELDVVLTGSGRLRAVKVASSSGHDMLDDAAVSAAREAFAKGVDDVDPVALEEFGVGPDEMIVPVPVQFRLQ